MGSNPKVNSVILPEFEFVPDFMPVQVIYTFHYYPTKTFNSLCTGQAQIWH